MKYFTITLIKSCKDLRKKMSKENYEAGYYIINRKELPITNIRFSLFHAEKGQSGSMGLESKSPP